MDVKTVPTFKTAFENEVYQGLTAFPKFLSSKWFYDEQGDKLFQAIMKLPEYYPTRKEYAILEQLDVHAFEVDEEGFDLIELGAGDGYKTKVLLKKLREANIPFSYKPIDISQNALDGLSADLKNRFPKLDVEPLQGRYFTVLDELSKYSQRKKVILMLGSNLGNLPHPKAIEFLRQLGDTLNPQDLIFMGFDLKKDPAVILPAYNDSQGVTAAFNKNVLHRINRELKANFEVDHFQHVPLYDPETGTCKSYLMATQEMDVRIESLDLEVHFYKWETIHTEISQKYEHSVIKWLYSQAGLHPKTYFTDDEDYFADYILTKT